MNRNESPSHHMEVSWNGGTPKSFIFVGFSLKNYHPAIGNPHFQDPHQAGWVSPSPPTERPPVVWDMSRRPSLQLPAEHRRPHRIAGKINGWVKLPMKLPSWGNQCSLTSFRISMDIYVYLWISMDIYGTRVLTHSHIINLDDLWCFLKIQDVQVFSWLDYG